MLPKPAIMKMAIKRYDGYLHELDEDHPYGLEDLKLFHRRIVRR